MIPSVKAILARFDGDVHKAISYCTQISKEYPRLRTEYDHYKFVLGQQ
jgi:hypothetical protein